MRGVQNTFRRAAVSLYCIIRIDKPVAAFEQRILSIFRYRAGMGLGPS